MGARTRESAGGSGWRLPSALCSGAEIFGVDLPVEVLADEVADDGEDHHQGRLADAYKGDQEDYKPRDEGSPLLVGPGGHLPFLSLRGGSLHRDFDVFDGDALLPEHPPDVLPDARRRLGVVARRRHPYAARDQVVPTFGGERNGGRLGPHLPGGALGEGLHGATRDHGLLARRVVHDRAPRHPPAEGQLPEQQQQGDERHQDAHYREHGAYAVGEGRDREVAQSLEPAPVARVGVDRPRREHPEGHEQEQHRDRYEQHGDDQHDDAVESVHCTLVLACRGSTSLSLTLSLLTGTPRWASLSRTERRRSDCMALLSSPRRTRASRSTWAPGLLLAFTRDEVPKTPGVCSAASTTSSATVPRVM